MRQFTSSIPCCTPPLTCNKKCAKTCRVKILILWYGRRREEFDFSKVNMDDVEHSNDKLKYLFPDVWAKFPDNLDNIINKYEINLLVLRKKYKHYSLQYILNELYQNSSYVIIEICK